MICCSSLDPIIKGLERNQFFASFLYGLERNSISAYILTMSYTLLALSFSLMTLMLSTSRFLQGVNLCLSCSLLSCMLAGVLKEVSVHVHIAMVLEELDGWSRKDLDATLWFLCDVFPSIFMQWSLEGISGGGFCLVFYGWNRLRNIFAQHLNET